MNTITRKLTILGSPYQFPHQYYPQGFRGIERETPRYVSEDESQQVNELFFEWVDKSEGGWITQDLDVCRRVVEAYANLDTPQALEIIELTDGQDAPLSEVAEFLGFDVVCASTSLLSSGLALSPTSSVARPTDEIVKKMKPLFQLVETHFKPHLNSNGLFDEHGLADFFLQVAMSLRSIRPNLWEGPGCEFKVIGIWKVV